MLENLGVLSRMFTVVISGQGIASFLKLVGLHMFNLCFKVVHSPRVKNHQERKRQKVGEIHRKREKGKKKQQWRENKIKCTRQDIEKQRMRERQRAEERMRCAPGDLVQIGFEVARGT